MARTAIEPENLNEHMNDHAEKDKQFHAEIAPVYDYVTVEPRDLANNILFKPFGALIRKGKLMLDLGCGTGHMLLRYRGRCAKQVGVDHSPEMLEIARKKLTAAGSDVLFVISDVEEYLEGFSGTAPDFITCVGFLHHLQGDELNEMTGLIHDVLAPGGQLLIAEPIHGPGAPRVVSWLNSKSILVQRLAESMPSGLEDPDEEPLLEDDLLESLRSAGFSIVKTNKGIDVFPITEKSGPLDKALIWLQCRLFRRAGDVIAVLAEK
jgi:ubiquinone/menaquinone biosynthesis C-methylase UbiE